MRNVPVWLGLTMLMGLAVAAAAIVFLLQGRNLQQTELASLRGAATESAEMVATADAEAILQDDAIRSLIEARDQAQDGLAVAETTVEALEGALSSAENERNSLSDALDQMEATVEVIPQRPAPSVVIVQPKPNATLTAGEPVQVIVTASDGVALARVDLTINGRTITTTTDDPLFTKIETAVADENGTLEIVASAVNQAGVSSRTATVQLEAESPAVVEAAPTATPTVAAASLEAQNEARRLEVEQNVIALRGLPQLEPVTQTLLTPAELRAKYEEEFAADYTAEEAFDDVVTYAAFDLLPSDFPLYDFLIDFLSESVGGYYDPETSEFVVISDDAELDIYELWIHAHEFMHALQDQHFDLERISDDDIEPEAAFALRALAEGEAELIQLQYLFEIFTEEEFNELVAIASAQQSDLGEIPDVILQEFGFPYNHGSTFVETLYNDGGWEAIDAAWENLPQTTEHILHPDKYLEGDLPEIVALAPLTDTLGSDYRLVDEDVLGEFYMRLYLQTQMGEAVSIGAAAGWDGDRYAVYYSDSAETIVMTLRTAWDSEPDASDFFNTYQVFAGMATGVAAERMEEDAYCWQGAYTLCAYWQDGEPLVVRAPDVDVALEVVEALR